MGSMNDAKGPFGYFIIRCNDDKNIYFLGCPKDSSARSLRTSYREGIQLCHIPNTHNQRRDNPHGARGAFRPCLFGFYRSTTFPELFPHFLVRL
jgi:hypothetical protein